MIKQIYPALSSLRRGLGRLMRARSDDGTFSGAVQDDVSDDSRKLQEGWIQILSVSPLVLLAKPTQGAPMGMAGAVAPLLTDREATVLMSASWSFELDDYRGLHARAFLEYLSAYPRHRLYFLANTEKEADLVSRDGVASLLANQNCLMNERIFRPLPEVDAKYDAIAVARLSAAKRPELACEIGRLALVYFYSSFDQTIAEFHENHARLRALMPHAVFVNTLTPSGCQHMGHKQVNEWLARSRVGLCLSPVEGAMRASMEYLLAGLSVVSTPSLGGRDHYFDEEFCIVAEPDPRSIREAVEALVARNVPRDYVRSKTLAKVEVERRRYAAFVQGLIDEAGGGAPFEPRFRELLYGPGVIPWRQMPEFTRQLKAALAGSHSRLPRKRHALQR